jgi:dynein heavy chain
MNPTAGSNYVNPRLQLRFVTFAMGFPGATSLLTIFQTFLDGHLKLFEEEISAISVNIINATLDLHNGVCDNFKKSAINFHYEFNIR